MKGEANAFGRGKNAIDVRRRTGAMTFKAQDELDAVFLCMLYHVFWGVWAKDGARERLYRFLYSEMKHPEDFAAFATPTEEE